MRYRIGEVAEFFGMTKEGVRFLERQGIITSQRDESNGYRYYDRPEITRLKQIRSYQALGFSLEEAADMVCRTKRGDLLTRIDEKLEELGEKEEQIRRMKGMLLDQRRAVQSALQEENGIQLAMRPELILFPAVREEASGVTPAEKEAITQARHAEKIWIQAMPPVMLGAIHYDEKGNTTPNKYGCVARMETVRELGLPILPSMIHLRECLCVRGALAASPLQAGQRRPVDISTLLQWSDAHGYKVCGEIYATMQSAYCDENGKIRWINEFYLPVLEK